MGSDDMSSVKTVVITGASGFVGRQLVPRLQAAGCQLLLVGRDINALEARFPGIDCCEYDDLPVKAHNFDTLVHLAVLNNTADAPVEAFEQVNVQLLSKVLDLAKSAGINRFVNVTTFHATDGKDSVYAQSKRKALDIIAGTEGIAITNLFLPAVYGDEFAGKLAIVTKMPGILRGTVFNFLAALAPTVHIDQVAQTLVTLSENADSDVYIASPQEDNIVFRIGKYVLDLAFIVALLGAFWWLLLIVWILIMLDSRGPGIFAQKRIGKGGKPFTIYKFRTMKQGTRQVGTHEMSADEITRVGAILRKTKLDELSQVFNVVIGNLSLVGPRPCLPNQIELIEEREKRGVLAVRPGITGLAQINKVDMSDPVKLARWDARYIAQRSLTSELKIAIVTFIGKGTGDRVSR